MSHQFAHILEGLSQRERLALQAQECRALALTAESPFREQLLELAARIERYAEALPAARTDDPK
ncbi:MAG: hypothetical protein AB7E79_13335 [Rhodospirillaceae bacterium]